jgi:hypothetical protein
MKKPAQKLRLSRETLADLDSSTLAKVAGGLTANKTICETLGSCGHICP